MTQWCRLWEDMPTDPKWRLIARRSGRPVHQIVSVFCAMMCNASAATKRGHLVSWDDEVIAISLDMEEADVRAIREAMQGKVLNGNELLAWEKRQPKREDDSRERLRAYRQRQNDMKHNVTHGNETASSETHQNGSVTHRNAPEERREDTEERRRLANQQSDPESEPFGQKRKKREKNGSAGGVEDFDFDRFWRIWPNKVAKPGARLAFKKVHAEVEQILLGIPRYIAAKPADRAWMHPATFLNGRRWEDSPAVQKPQPRSPFPPGIPWRPD